MVDAYDEEQVEGRERVVLRLHPRLAPVKVAVLPLLNKEGQPEVAREIYEDLRTRMGASSTPAGRSASATGVRTRSAPRGGSRWTTRRWRTGTVTLRDRDSLEQSRLPIADLGGELEARLAAPWSSPKLG